MHNAALRIQLSVFISLYVCTLFFDYRYLKSIGRVSLLTAGPMQEPKSIYILIRLCLQTYFCDSPLNEVVTLDLSLDSWPPSQVITDLYVPNGTFFFFAVGVGSGINWLNWDKIHQNNFLSGWPLNLSIQVALSNPPGLRRHKLTPAPSLQPPPL